jgi:hypothetical protein
MHPLTRRTLLTYGATAVAGLAVGGFGLWEFDMTDVDALERAAISLDGRCDRLGVGPTRAEGRALLTLLDGVRPFPARAVTRVCLTMARAARWAGEDAQRWVTIALHAARESDDGSLLARCWEERATVVGQEALARGVGAGAVARGLLDAATVKAGADDDVRSLALYRLAYEHAAVGQRADARAALTRAEVAAERAGWSDAQRGTSCGTVLWALDDLPGAEFALSEGTGGGGSLRVRSFADLARVHLDSGSPDAALEDILQADHDSRALARVDITPRLRTTALLLPRPLRSIALDHLDEPV